MSSTEVRTKGGPAQGAVPPLEDCTPLFSLAAGAAGARVRRASGAAGGGDLRAAGGSCTLAAGVAPRRPRPRAFQANQLHLSADAGIGRAAPALSHQPTAPAGEAARGQER
jgi:hypothetical protein